MRGASLLCSSLLLTTSSCALAGSTNTKHPRSKPRQAKDNKNLKKPQIIDYSVDGVLDQHPTEVPDFNPYDHGFEHGLVATVVTDTPKFDGEDSKRLRNILEAFQTENDRQWGGQALGVPKGEVISLASAGRFREVTGIATSSSENLEKFRPDFNVLELGAHLGDGTLWLLSRLPGLVLEKPATNLPTVHLFSSESNENWLREQKKLVTHALSGFKDEKLQHDFVHFRALSLAEDIEWGAMIDSFITDHELPNGQFDLVILDHEEERFVPDLMDLIHRDALADGCVVIADNIQRKQSQLESYRKLVAGAEDFKKKYTSWYNFGLHTVLTVAEEDSDPATWFVTEKHLIEQPYEDVVYVSRYLRERAVQAGAAGKKIKREREEL